MYKIRLTDSSLEIYRQFEELYAKSFPIFEQRTQKQQMVAFASPDYYLDVYVENGVLIGFISYWKLDAGRYIEHFAVNDTIRGKGHGKSLLADFVSQEDSIVILEIDPLVDEVSRARLRFYQYCGFVSNVFEHSHQPYRDGYKPHKLVVLSSGRELLECEYYKFNTGLESAVMKFD